MTVAAAVPMITYAENGVTTVFAVPFRFDAASDLRAVRRAADGTETQLVLATDFTVTGGETDAGGSLTVAAAAPAGTTLMISRHTARVQPTDYIEAGPFTAESHEAALDRAVLMAQEQDVELARAVKARKGEAGPVMAALASLANKVLALSADGTQIVGADLLPAVEALANAATAAAAASAAAAAASADDAEAAAVIAQAVTGPLYASTAAGLAATVDGEEFAVNNGDGTAGIYLNVMGLATLQRTIIIDPSANGAAALIGTSSGDSVQEVLDGFTGSTGTVTSVNVSGGDTGLTTSGGPVTDSGTITLAGTLAVANGGTGATAAAGARTNLAAAARAQSAEQISGFIGSPSNKTYRLAIKMAHGGTITETTTRSASGTCTATFGINATPLGGTANAVSSTEQSRSHASANTFAAGDDIILTITANASCADLSFSIQYSRELA